MESPKITIIVPFFNSQASISKCITSILHQTLKDFELILVDDGSTDNSFDICREFAVHDNRIVLLQKENGGQGTARNIGLDIAQGNYIGFVDSDDFIDPDMYSIMLNACIENKAELAICGYNTFRSNRYKLKPLNCEGKKIFNNFELMEAYLSTNLISGGPCNKLYSKELFAHIRFPSLRMREDAYIMPNLLRNVIKAVYVGRNLYNWSLKLGSTERSKFSMNNLDAIESTSSLYKVVEAYYPSLLPHVEYKRIETKVELMKRIIFTNSFREYEDVYRRLKKEVCSKSKKLGELEKGFESLQNDIKLICKFDFLFRLKEYCIGNLKYYVKKILEKI